MFFINKTQNQKERHAARCADTTRQYEKSAPSGDLPSQASAFIKRENPSCAFYRISGQKARFPGDGPEMGALGGLWEPQMAPQRGFVEEVMAEFGAGQIGAVQHRHEFVEALDQ
jgi:hypothetical protein